MKLRYLIIQSLLIICLEGKSQIPPTGQSNESPSRYILPYDRIIQPAGLQIYFGEHSLENHAMDLALSPDNRWLAVEERFSIVFISTVDKKIKFVFDNDIYGDLLGGMNTYSGITWHNSSDGLEVYWSTIGNAGRSYVVCASWDGVKSELKRLFEYKTVPPARMALPNEIMIRQGLNKEFLYVVLNGNNKVIKQDLASGDTIWAVDPGVAPYGITSAAGKIYVTNWAGRNPDESDKDVAGVPWGLARVDNANSGGATREGSVTILDNTTGKILKQLVVGLHPGDIVSDKNGKFVYLTNANSDNVTVINTATDTISETISVRLEPDINPFFGDSPNGLCLSPNGKTLYVANGMDNALAVIKLGKKAAVKASDNNSTIAGFIPTGAYPSAVTASNPGYLYVCNLEAAGAREPLTNQNTTNMVFNSHNMLASISVIRVPPAKTLVEYTDTVVALNNLSRATTAMEKPRDSAKPKTVPERIGEPSVFKHVVYIIKENRTYDQVLGDMKQGDGDPGLCIYGAEVTPNAHKLSEEFMLLDNFYVSGKCSAEGHQWTDASIVTDYIEKNIRAWFRSYAHVQNDALVYAPTGFIWDNALKKGKTVRIYGEASVPLLDKSYTWSEIYKKYIDGEKVEFRNYSTIEPVRKILSQTYPSYGNHEFSDVMRADALIKELKEFESAPGDKLPELMVVALPNDHTTGIRPGFPTPRAMVADNDVALGRIVEAFTKSKFWENTVIFVVEDDSQAGWDHVSAYRTVCMVLSPYSRLKTVNHTYYTQPSMVRTIEQILGLPPMNIQDAIAKTMTDCFTSEPDLTPYTALPNKIPLDELTGPLRAMSGKYLHFAKMSMRPEFDGVDSGDDDLLNRILWFAAKGNTPYPAKFAGKDEDDDD